MPFLIANSERYELRLGDNTLGGRGEHGIPHPLLAELPPAAVITVQPDGTSEIRRLDPGIVVRVNGRFVGTGASRMHHGDRLDVAACRLVFVGVPGETTTADPAGRRNAPPITELAPVVPVEPATARLVSLRSGITVTIPQRGLVIGRSRSCGLVLDGDGVSRRHAVVAPSPDGFAVRDHSANGTWLNGVRVDRTATLLHGDVLRIGDDELRFEAEDAMTDQPAEDADVTRLASALSSTSGERPNPFLAALEVQSGPLKGTVYRIERPVCGIGRSSACDVSIPDDSVSATHATLLLKAGTWFVVDQRSANGTFVDGYRVAGERELAAGTLLRVGRVKMRFRPRSGVAVTPGGTQRVHGLLDRLGRGR